MHPRERSDLLVRHVLMRYAARCIFVSRFGSRQHDIPEWCSISLEQLFAQGTTKSAYELCHTSGSRCALMIQ